MSKQWSRLFISLKQNMFRNTAIRTALFVKNFSKPSFIQQNRFISTEIKDAIDKAVASSKVVLFMKGTPEFPQCGFSRATIQMLGQQGVDPENFAAYNVLEDPELREGIKEYSSWPTIPQLYVNKEFIGGCDIVMSMAQTGELGDLLEANGCLIPEEPTETQSAEVKPKDRS